MTDLVSIPSRLLFSKHKWAPAAGAHLAGWISEASASCHWESQRPNWHVCFPQADHCQLTSSCAKWTLYSFTLKWRKSIQYSIFKNYFIFLFEGRVDMSLTILYRSAIVLADSMKSLGVQVSKTIYSLFIQEILCVSLTREENNSSFYCICFHTLSVLNVWRR